MEEEKMTLTRSQVEDIIQEKIRQQTEIRQPIKEIIWTSDSIKKDSRFLWYVTSNDEGYIQIGRSLRKGQRIEDAIHREGQFSSQD